MVSSSAQNMRSLAPETTLLYARQLATTAGISEVRDITEMDVLGVPVFVRLELMQEIVEPRQIDLQHRR